MEHFGVRIVKRKYSLKLKREEFAIINTKPSLPKFDDLIQKNAYDDTGSYRKDWCESYRELCLQNFDLNMIHFNSLDPKDFNQSLNFFLKKYKKFREIKDLSDYDGISGYYLMILDAYKQIYIGKSDNIKRRIQQHWSKVKPFDRTLFPMYAVNSSILSIDFFRALDTTRIFVWRTTLLDTLEKQLINDFPKEYLANRIGGDIERSTVPLLEAMSTTNKRNLKAE